MTVGEFRSYIDTTWHRIIPLDLAMEFLKVHASFASEQEFLKARSEARDSVSALLNKIAAAMETDSLHKAQTLYRKAPALLRFFVVERILYGTGILKDEDPNRWMTDAPTFSTYIREWLIESYNQKLDKTTP